MTAKDVNTGDCNCNLEFSFYAESDSQPIRRNTKSGGSILWHYDSDLSLWIRQEKSNREIFSLLVHRFL